MRSHDKARWLRSLDDNAVQEIPASYPWAHDCGEQVPATFGGKEVEAEALCHTCARRLGLAW